MQTGDDLMIAVRRLIDRAILRVVGSPLEYFKHSRQYRRTSHVQHGL